ncbi:MAG: hypothetical protein PHD48_05500 [Alphaproteobacteria bacterium]|nr:hypothetical protein [Alphaproteobacteria bacterium]
MNSLIQIYYAQLRQKLSDVDLCAQENVLSGKGGPFAARLALFSVNEEGSRSLLTEFPHATNKVLETGIASNHAEAQSLVPETVGLLKKQLRHIKQERPKDRPIIVLFSSAQPCWACLTKIEILARQLIQEELIKPKNFVLLYGATYTDTEITAGFHDYAYALDFFNVVKDPPSEASLIQYTTSPFAQAPEHVQAAFKVNPAVTAVLTLNHRTLGLGQDRRNDQDLFHTAECTAMHEASRTLKAEGQATPWNLHGSHLYTLNPKIGPLTYSECQWAAVEHITSLSGAAPVPPQATMQYQESCDLSNRSFSALLVKGFNTPNAVTHVLHDACFANLAQKAWAQHPSHILYNGLEAGDSLTIEQKTAFNRLFCPETLPIEP